MSARLTAHRCALLAAVLALMVFSPPAANASILWQRGAEIWAMNDDGSVAHALITPSQIPGVTSVQEPQVDPTGSTIVFDADTHQFDHQVGVMQVCGLNCVGIYSGSAAKLRG
jgi:hypothetical protein